MARVFITGSADGLGMNAAKALLDGGHEVVVHARSRERAAVFAGLSPLGIVIGDLSSAGETRAVADQVNAIGRMDAVIHNAAVYREPSRGRTLEGHARLVAINTLAPYLLTAWLDRPARLIFMSSGMHRGGDTSLDDLDWTSRPWDATAAYSESKLHVTALALALARRWPGVKSNAVNPGWVPTKMGGAGAPDDLEEGHRTQTWLATSDAPAAQQSGEYWHHRKTNPPAPETKDPSFQDALLARLAALTRVVLP